MQGIFTVAVWLLASRPAAAKMTTEAMHAQVQQAHDDAKLLRMKLPADVSDDKVLDLTKKMITRGVPMEVLQWYLDHEQGRGRTGEVLVADIEALATSMGGGERMHGILRPSTASLIEQIKKDEEIPDASLDKPFMWSDEEYAEDLKLMQKPAIEKTGEQVSTLQLAAEPVQKVEKAEKAEAEASTDEARMSSPPVKAEATTSEKKGSDVQSWGFWDVVFFALLGLVIFVAGWWAIKLRLHDRFLAALSDMLFSAKKWLAGVLKPGRDYDTQSDDITETSLQTGTDGGSDTTSSSGMGGVNTHLQGVIDRVRSSFQEKGAAGAADEERPAPSEEAPAKKGYTRQTKK